MVTLGEETNLSFGTIIRMSESIMVDSDVGFADEYFTHTASMYYRGDTWTFGAGINNVFDKAPPEVDSNEIASSINNVPIGYGYNLQGRTYFLNVAKQF